MGIVGGNVNNSCLVGCVAEKQCSGGPNVTPYNYAVLAPFVEVKFGGGTLTVGNKSSPSNQNMAIITAFSLSMSNGLRAKIDITDQEGGQFYNFFNNLLKCVKDTNKKVEMDFGWIGKNCDGSSNKISVVTQTGKSIFGLPQTMKVEKAAGSFHYTVECIDIGAVSTAAKAEENYGDDKFNRLDLKQAIMDLCQNEPPYIDVRFVRRVPGGGEKDWDFQAINDPPKSGWKTNNQSKIQIINEWIRPYKTDERKGIIIIDDDTKPNSIVLLEDPLPECKNASKCMGKRLGNFIVNGGNCSNVLEFNPSMDWVLAWGAKTSGGEGGSPMSSQTIKNKGELPNDDGCGDRSHIGIVSGVQMTNDTQQNYGEKAIIETEKSQNAHQHANSVFTTCSAVTADLKIMGLVEPGYVHIMEEGSIVAFVSIVYINPFYVSNQKDGDCPKWLAQPPCNQVLSSTNWLIKEVTHEITGGHFITKLQVQLIAPAIDTDSGSMLGGDAVPVSCDEETGD